MESEMPCVALSIKQPWAALVVAGLKSIEIRRWPTVRRGRILIHAGRVADERHEAWQHVTPEAQALTKLRGGILGAVELTNCLAYRTLEAFQADQLLHRNELSWFDKPVLYGLVFQHPERVPFQRYPGWFRFFPVTDLPGISSPVNSA